MSEKLFSVVVPVYNAEKTIRRCVNSLICQADDSVELILVDDGSSDRSGKLCAEYAEQHENVILVSQPNGGVSAARNAGIARASGKYVLFVDSDDFVSSQLFSVLNSYAEQDWDYIHFSNCKVSGDTMYKRRLTPREVHVGEPLAETIVDMICKKTINSPWAKAFRREILSDYQIHFPVNLSLGEDKVFNLRFLLCSASYIALSDSLYCVCVDAEDSLSRKQRADLQEQLDSSLALCRKALDEAEVMQADRKTIEEALNYMELRNIYSVAKELHREGLSAKERLFRIRKLCSDFNQKRLRCPSGKKNALIAAPVQMNLALAIDTIARKLLR